MATNTISTTVFAPTVRTVQPAFIYSEGEVKIYFSLSSYNRLSDIARLRYSLIDPNKKSTSGNNSMFISGTYKEVAKSSIKEAAAAEYYFTITFNDTEFKSLNLNQYYQIQIELLDNGSKWSAPSQATLIRPISAGEFTFDLANSVEAMSLSTITGQYRYADGSTQEYLVSYNLKIKKDSSTELEYETGWIHNVNGLIVFIEPNYIFEEGVEYTLAFEGKTVNGYYFTKIQNIVTITYQKAWTEFQFLKNEEEPNEKTLAFKNDICKGAIQLKVKFPAFDGSMFVQRTSEDSDFKLWETIFELEVEPANNFLTSKGIYIYDYYVNGNTKHYRYRFLKNEGDSKYIAKSDDWTIECIYEDIFLSNTEKQLGIKYNPNITNFKWVTQENITNTLGGKFPLIRRNCETYYRQFNLSGTLYFDPLLLGSVNSKDSRQKSMEAFLPTDDTSLFIDIKEAFGGAFSAYNWEERDYNKRVTFYEQRFKDAAMRFLTDGKPKLFKSPTEGMMIVYLSGVSFTPNKQLDRRIVDFSATVTEFAELNNENLIKYGIMPEVDIMIYSFVANKSDENGALYMTPYIPDSELLTETDLSKNYLKVIERRVRI